MNVDHIMNQFRVASRELFNHYFYVSNPRENGDAAWEAHQRFVELEEVLFQKMVVDSASIVGARYGDVQPMIQVIPVAESIPAMINREIDSGYWDDPLERIDQLTQLRFISYFDWDSIDYHDNRYVRVQISDCSSHPEIINKHALIESHYVHYQLA